VADLNLSGLSVAQLTALGDGAMRAGHHQLAAAAYGAALKASDGKPPALLSRLGLARQPSADTAAMFAALGALEPLSPNLFIGEGLATWRKTLPFFEDARFREIADKLATLLPLPNWHWNLQTVLWAVEQAREVEGDFVELGVFRGHTTAFCAEYVGFQTWPKRWWLYDTFAGIPDDQVEPGWAETNRRLYDGTFSYEEVKARFEPWPNVDVILGRVPEVLEKAAPDAIAFMHLDLNNVTAEIAALDKLWERISPGGVIVLDDYGWASAKAQHLAERSWFARHGVHVLSLPTGQGMVVKAAPR
jgi:O-methyltransferase